MELTACPFQAMPLLHFILELRPELEITYGAGVTEPDSEFIVDESAVVKEVVFPPWHQLVFMECIKDSCPRVAGETPIPVPEICCQ